MFTGYDSFSTAPDFESLRLSLRTGDWARLEAELVWLPADRASFAISALAEVDLIEAGLQQGIARLETCPALRTALAMRYITIGWKARTDSESSAVSEAQFATFATWLRQAEQALIGVCARHPDFAPAWVARLITARGLQLGESEARRRYRRLTELSPNNFSGQTQLLQFLSPKWFGTEESAAEFARTTAQSAPPGTNAGALVAIYHLEHWIAIGAGDPGLAYLAQRSVHEELRAAAVYSVLHSTHQMDVVGVEAHSAFAMAYWLGRHLADAATHMQILNGRASEFPWSYALENPSRMVSISQEILAAGRTR